MLAFRAVGKDLSKESTNNLMTELWYKSLNDVSLKLGFRIVWLKREGKTNSEIAERFHMTEALVERILRREERIKGHLSERRGSDKDRAHHR